MKERLAYLAIAVLMLFVLASIARAEQVVIKHKCKDLETGSQAYWACNDSVQGASKEYSLSAWQDLKALAIKKGYKLPRKVVLIDPIKGRGYWEYKTYLKGKTLYFAAMEPCQHIDRREGLRALRGLR